MALLISNHISSSKKISIHNDALPPGSHLSCPKLWMLSSLMIWPGRPDHDISPSTSEFFLFFFVFTYFRAGSCMRGWEIYLWFYLLLRFCLVSLELLHWNSYHRIREVEKIGKYGSILKWCERILIKPTLTVVLFWLQRAIGSTAETAWVRWGTWPI